jgi:hypothetical protein
MDDQNQKQERGLSRVFLPREKRAKLRGIELPRTNRKRIGITQIAVPTALHLSAMLSIFFPRVIRRRDVDVEHPLT